MRRKDREITDIQDILNIINKCDCCYISLYCGEYPYVIPMSFGFSCINNTIKLYFHCANSGTKLEIIQNNGNAGFSMSTSRKLIKGDISCACTMEFESVCGNGNIRVMNDDEKQFALEKIMEKYNGKGKYHFNEKVLMHTITLELTVNEISGKRLKK